VIAITERALPRDRQARGRCAPCDSAVTANRHRNSCARWCGSRSCPSARRSLIYGRRLRGW